MRGGGAQHRGANDARVSAQGCGAASDSKRTGRRFAPCVLPHALLAPPALRASTPRRGGTPLTKVLVARPDALDKLPDRRHEPVRIKGIAFELERAVPGKDEIFVDGSAMRYVLQRFLDAETSRVGEIAGRPVVIILPRRKAAVRQAAHAVCLVLANGRLFLRRNEHQRIRGGFERVGKPRAIPAARTHQVTARDPEIAPLHADIELMRVIARRRDRKGDLAFASRLQIALVGQSC